MFDMSEPIPTSYSFYTEDADKRQALQEYLDEMRPRPSDREPIHDGNGIVADWDELNYGFNNPLERFCIEHEIAFDVAIPSHYEIQGNIRWWRPGMEVKDNELLPGESVDRNQEGDPVVRVTEVQAALAGHEGMAPEEILPSLTKWVESLLPPPLYVRCD